MRLLNFLAIVCDDEPHTHNIHRLSLDFPTFFFFQQQRRNKKKMEKNKSKRQIENKKPYKFTVPIIIFRFFFDFDFDLVHRLVDNYAHLLSFRLPNRFDLRLFFFFLFFLDFGLRSLFYILFLLHGTWKYISSNQSRSSFIQKHSFDTNHRIK